VRDTELKRGALTKAAKKRRPRSVQSQSDELQSLFRRISHGRCRDEPLLDPSKEYEVDEHAAAMFPAGLAILPEHLTILRRAVASAGESAVMAAWIDLEHCRFWRVRAKRLLDLATEFAEETADIADLLDDPDMIAGGLLWWLEATDGTKRTDLLPVLERLVGDLTWLGQATKRLRVTEPMPSRAEPLAKWFIKTMLREYRNIHKDPAARPPGTRDGPFAQLLAAAWRDLGFPIVARDPEGLVEYLGRRLTEI
jgi:hypothetical protein